MYHERVQSIGALDDAKVKRYIRALSALRKGGVDYLKLLQEHRGKTGAGLNVYKQIEKTIREAGFKNYPEFVMVNARIAWAWNISQGQIALCRFDAMQDKFDKMEDATTAMFRRQYQTFLDDPDVPEATKKELRAQMAGQMADIKKQRSERRQSYQKNRQWAQKAMNLVSPLTSSKDMKVIMRHEKELMAAFSGLSEKQLEQLRRGSLDQIDRATEMIQRQ